MKRGPNTTRPRRDIEASDPSLRALLVRIEERRSRARRQLSRAELSRSPGGSGADAATAPPTIPTPRPAPHERGRARGAPPGTVLDVTRVTDDLLRFTVARPPDFTYSPGDSVRLELDGVRRRYTLASAPHESDLEFFVELVPGGRMSARLASLRPGASVTLSGGPKRGIAFDDKASRHLMLATVTGVNPFVSILRDAVQQGRRDLGCVLVHGASFADEFGYREELDALASERPDLLTYIPTVSRPDARRNAGWTGATGRADTLIDETLASLALTPGETTAYACGNPGMVDTATRKLGQLGFGVRAERYT